jgi:hypothetical protein
MKTITTFFLILFLGIGFTACEKDPGKGGTSTIRGKVIIREYNRDFTIQKVPDYPGAKEDVFIIYGDDAVYGDKFETDYNGVYEFNYLREGSYTVFAYSKDSTKNYDLTSEEIPVIRQVEITAKNQTVEVPDIIVLK